MAGGPTRTALVVDDEAPVLSVLRRYLERGGWQVQEASTAERALELLGDSMMRPDVVLCDLNLPGLSGGDLLQQISASHPELSNKLVLTSGDPLGAEQEMQRHGLHCPVLGKPFTLADLKRTMESMSCVA